MPVEAVRFARVAEAGADLQVRSAVAAATLLRPHEHHEPAGRTLLIGRAFEPFEVGAANEADVRPFGLPNLFGLLAAERQVILAGRKLAGVAHPIERGFFETLLDRRMTLVGLRVPVSVEFVRTFVRVVRLVMRPAWFAGLRVEKPVGKGLPALLLLLGTVSLCLETLPEFEHDLVLRTPQEEHGNRVRKTEQRRHRMPVGGSAAEDNQVQHGQHKEDHATVFDLVDDVVFHGSRSSSPDLGIGFWSASTTSGSWYRLTKDASCRSRRLISCEQ